MQIQPGTPIPETIRRCLATPALGAQIGIATAQGPPPPVFRHDICHVLGGYGTTAAEEAGVIGFQAGFERRDPFDVLMFVMAEFELGIGVSPFLPGAFGQIDPERLFAGIAHGRQVNTDLIRDIDPWEHFADPLSVVREHFSIPPRGRAPEEPEEPEEPERPEASS